MLNKREIQLEELEVLKVIDEVCKQNMIEYQIFGGTLLGAIRHKGFIPWDDDVDLCMLRKDYDRFLEIGQKELGKKYFLQNFDTDPDFPFTFTKVRKNFSLALEQSLKHKNIHHGVWVDIFPLDAVPDNKIIKALYLFKLRVLGVINKSTYFKNVEADFLLQKNIMKRGVINLLMKMTDIFPGNYFLKKTDLLMKKYNNKQHSDVAHLTMAFKKRNFSRFENPLDVYRNSVHYCFENHSFLGPKSYESVLKKCYGNYKKIPSEKERALGHSIEIFRVNTEKERGI